MQSALGQPLRAEVEITSLSKEESASLGARLAPVDAFRQAGLEFNPALNALRFAIDRRPDGRAFVRITSTQPINEPFVDLLVELNWAAGRFVREYTFLLDPPELRIAGRDTVDGGRQVSVLSPVAAPANQPAATQATPVQPAQVPQQPQPATSSQSPAQPRPGAQPREQSRRPAGPTTVEVRPGDTLAGIAAQVKPEGVSLDQTLVALYQANPAAFFGSIHQLNAGATLTVPERQAIAAIDPDNAREQVRVQTRDFNEYRSRLAETARAVPATRSGQTVQGSVTARVEDKGAPPAARDQLKLSKSESAAGPAAGAGAATGTAASRSGVAAEQGVARDAALREAQSQITDLEKNVGDLQRLLELKNRQLADLQKQIDELKVAGRSSAGAVAPAASAPAAVAASAPQPAPASATPAAAAPAVQDTQKPVGDEPKPVADAAPKADAVADAPKADAAPTPPAEAKPAPVAAAPAAQPGLLDDMMSNPLMLPGLGAILALGAGYGWYAMRRRRRVEKFEDSLIAADGFASNSLFGSTGGQSVDTSSSSVFGASVKDSGVDVHSTEVDPIAEAEVYIAYGREAQAEEILKEALKRQPERQAIRAKLLEIYSGRKDVAAFNALAAEMHRMAGGQNEEWPKAVTMGLALDPDNALYTGREPAQTADAGQPDEPLAAAEGDPFSQAALGAAKPAAAESPEASSPVARNDDAGIDFGVLDGAAVSFEETRPLADDEPERKAEALDEVPSLDFDLELDTTIGRGAEMLSPGSDPEVPGADTELARALEGRFELPSLDLGGADASPDSEEGEVAVSGLDDLNIDLPALEGLTRTAVPSSSGGSPSSSTPTEADLDLSSIGLDLEAAPASAPSGSESIRWQEMATKLDLASAYEEIGDKEGARELLEEVVRGGDAEQQRKARGMLSKIG